MLIHLARGDGLLGKVVGGVIVLRVDVDGVARAGAPVVVAALEQAQRKRRMFVGVERKLRGDGAGALDARVAGMVCGEASADDAMDANAKQCLCVESVVASDGARGGGGEGEAPLGVLEGGVGVDADGDAGGRGGGEVDNLRRGVGRDETVD